MLRRPDPAPVVVPYLDVLVAGGLAGVGAFALCCLALVLVLTGAWRPLWRLLVGSEA